MKSAILDIKALLYPSWTFQTEGVQLGHVPSAVDELKGGFATDEPPEADEAAAAEAGDDEEALLPFAGGLLPRPQIEKSKSSALYSRLCFSKYCRNSLRDRNFLPSGLRFFLVDVLINYIDWL